MSVVEIQKSVSDLSADERAKLVVWLLDSLPPSGDDDASAESLGEAVRRREELNAGRISPMTSQQFWAGLERERD
jgi:putative addiction module component (TIGR02574 family)